MADQPHRGGRCKWKKRKTRPKKRSIRLRLPSSSLVQVGGKQERFFCRLGWKADDRDSMQGGMDPGDEAQPPIGSIQANNARADLIQAHRPLQQGARERGVMNVGRREQKEKWQAGTATEQGMHTIATQEWSWMLGRGMTNGGIGVSSAPSQDGSTLDDQITSPNEAAA